MPEAPGEMAGLAPPDFFTNFRHCRGCPQKQAGRQFDPRCAAAFLSIRDQIVRAMMDLSDGLAKDLPRLAGACGLGFELWESKIPITPGCTLDQAMGDGEDYELLLAASPNMKVSMQQEWHRFFPKLPLTIIGRLLPLKGKALTKLKGGWEHFR